METVRQRGWAVLACALCALCLRSPSLADEWALPPRQYRSADRKFALWVGWQPRRMELVEKKAHGFSKRWSIAYPNKAGVDAAPAAVYVTGDGNHVVLRDQWGGIGYGKVLTFLGPKGDVLRSYTLAQILPAEEILYAQHSISSVWWSRNGLFFFDRRQTRFEFVTGRGTVRAFDLATGRAIDAQDAREEARNQAHLAARQALAAASPEARITGATMAGVLEDKASVPDLQRLLADRTVTARILEGHGPYYKIYGVQLAAGRALVTLLGAGAVPLLKADRPQGSRYMAREWRTLLTTAEAQVALRRWEPTQRVSP